MALKVLHIDVPNPWKGFCQRGCTRRIWVAPANHRKGDFFCFGLNVHVWPDQKSHTSVRSSSRRRERRFEQDYVLLAPSIPLSFRKGFRACQSCHTRYCCGEYERAPTMSQDENLHWYASLMCLPNTSTEISTIHIVFNAKT